MTRKRLFLILAVVGTVIPWLFFSSFFAAEGLDLLHFARSLFANGAAGGFTSDVLISLVVFWFWSFGDSRARGVGHWWLVLPAGCLVGLSLALPLYLYLREGTAAGVAE